MLGSLRPLCHDTFPTSTRGIPPMMKREVSTEAIRCLDTVANL